MAASWRYVLIDESLWTELQERATERSLRGGSVLISQYLGRFISEIVRGTYKHSNHPVYVWDSVVYGFSRRIKLGDGHWEWLDSRCAELQIPRHLLINGILKAVMTPYSGRAGYKPIQIL